MEPYRIYLGQWLDGLFWTACFFTALIVVDLLFIQSSRRRWALDLTFALLSALTLLFFSISDGFTGAGINEATWYHIKLGTTGLTWGVVAGIVEKVLLYGAGFVALAWISAKLGRRRNSKRAAGQPPHITQGNVAALCLGLAYLGALGASPATVQGTTMLSNYLDREENQRELSAQSRPIEANIAKPARPLSVVYIYAESLEATFLDDRAFPGLAPNLRRLKSEALSMDNIQQSPFTGWTIAGIIASQCGFPALGDMRYKDGNFGKDVVCISDILAQQGYALSYLNGADMAFAGKDHFFGAHQFQTIKGRDQLLAEIGPRPVSDWGVYDDDLFGAVNAEFERLLAQDAPFFLGTLTVDTHPPEGFPSQYCRKMGGYGDGKNAMLNAVHCSDKMIHDLVRQLQAKARSAGRDDILIIVGSDHLQSARSSLANTMLQAQESKRRNLWLALHPDIRPRSIQRLGTTFDYAPTILSLMGMDVPAMHLGRDLLRPEPTLSEKYGSERFYTLVRSAFSMNERGRWSQDMPTPSSRLSTHPHHEKEN